MTVFIDGMPAARRLDKTDVGTIIIGSPDVLLGESAPGPLAPFQAAWLYKYLDSQRDEIPFEFARNGCYARADRMCALISGLGILVGKQWVRKTRASGQLHVPIENCPGGGVRWDYHVAPIVQVTQSGAIETMVIDPSLGFGRPVAVAEWIQKQTSKPAAVVTGLTSKDVYLRAWNATTETWEDSRNTLSDSGITRRDLDIFREARATPPSDGGCNISNKPVHY